MDYWMKCLIYNIDQHNLHLLKNMYIELKAKMRVASNDFSDFDESVTETYHSQISNLKYAFKIKWEKINPI